MSDTHSMQADLSIVCGSTLQIIPAGNMPTYGKKYNPNSKLVICNLQPTKQDKKADLCIHTYVDDVMRMLMTRLNLEIPEYDPTLDPVKQVKAGQFPNGIFLDWTQDAELAGDLNKVGQRVHEDYLALKREERKRKNVQKEEEALVKSNKMQKRAEAEAMLVKDEESDEDKDDVPLAMRLNNLNGKNKNGHVKTEDEKEEVPKDANRNGAAENLKAETMPPIGSETEGIIDHHHNENVISEMDDTNDERDEGNDSSEDEKVDETAEGEENGHIIAF